MVQLLWTKGKDPLKSFNDSEYSQISESSQVLLLCYYGVFQSKKTVL